MSQSSFCHNLGVPNGASAVTKSDVTVLPSKTVEIYVGGVGDVALLFWGDTAAVTFSAVPAGTTIRGNVQKVMSTNTTATLMVCKYVK